MTSQTRRTASLVLALGFAATAFAGDTIEDVAKKITAASNQLKSFSAKSKMVTEMNQTGFSMVSTSHGTTEMLRKGKTLLVRTETNTVSATTVGGNTTKSESSTLVVMDGTWSYTLSTISGTTSAYKMKFDKTTLEDPFKPWKTTADLTVLADSEIDGRAVWTIEAKPKQTGATGKTVIAFDKKTGQMLKMVSYTPDGKPMTTMTYTDIKVNEKIDADRFVFKAPAGVEVTEMMP